MKQKVLTFLSQSANEIIKQMSNCKTKTDLTKQFKGKTIGDLLRSFILQTKNELPKWLTSESDAKVGWKNLLRKEFSRVTKNPTALKSFLKEADSVAQKKQPKMRQASKANAAKEKTDGKPSSSHAGTDEKKVKSSKKVQEPSSVAEEKPSKKKSKKKASKKKSKKKASKKKSKKKASKKKSEKKASKKKSEKKASKKKSEKKSSK